MGGMMEQMRRAGDQGLELVIGVLRAIKAHDLATVVGHPVPGVTETHLDGTDGQAG